MITKNMYLDMESDMALEELQEELEGIKLMFNEKNCIKTRKKEKKFKNKFTHFCMLVTIRYLKSILIVFSLFLWVLSTQKRFANSKQSVFVN